MAMSMGSGKGPMIEINTTPLIDVMLVLLVTLIVTLPIMTHTTKIDLPQRQHQPPKTPPRVRGVLNPWPCRLGPARAR